MDNQENQTNNSQPVTPPTAQASSQKKWIIIIVIVVIALYFLQSFIFSPVRITERMLESATGGEYDISIDENDGGSYTVTGEDGESVNVTSGGSAKLPDNWPSTVPIPSDAVIEYAAVIGGSADESVATVNYTSGDSIDSIKDLYKSELNDNGWSIQAEVTTGEGVMLSASRDENEGASVYLSAVDGKTSVMVSVQTTK